MNVVIGLKVKAGIGQNKSPRVENERTDFVDFVLPNCFLENVVHPKGIEFSSGNMELVYFHCI